MTAERAYDAANLGLKMLAVGSTAQMNRAIAAARSWAVVMSR